MNDYSMPTYFQNMPVLNAPAYKPNPDNVAELKKIEEEIHAQAEKMLSAGTPDDKIHQKGQYTASVVFTLSSGETVTLDISYTVK